MSTHSTIEWTTGAFSMNSRAPFRRSSERKPIHLRIPQLKAQTFVQAVCRAARGTGGQIHRPSAGRSRHANRFLGQGCANALTAHGLVDHDVFDARPQTGRNREHEQCQRAHDHVAAACQQDRVRLTRRHPSQRRAVQRPGRSGQLRQQTSERLPHLVGDLTQHLDPDAHDTQSTDHSQHKPITAPTSTPAAPPTKPATSDGCSPYGRRSDRRLDTADEEAA